MIQALVGILGVLIGILLNELLRRGRRIEDYSAKVFEQRLKVHEELYRRILDCYATVNEVLEGKYSAEERHAIMAARVFPLLDFMDRNSLYLNDEITVHCGGMWLSVDEIPSLADEGERKSQTEEFQRDFADAKAMIKEESGLKRIDKLFHAITRPRYSSRLINYYRELQKERSRVPLETDNPEQRFQD